MGPSRLTVAVLTFRRPADLGRGLPLLLEQVTSINEQLSSRVVADVLVVDNDPEASAQQVALGSADTLVRYVVESAPGISAARNCALDTAGGDLLVFIDDDEVPHAGWLWHLFRTWEQTRAAAVSGRVVAEFEGEVDPWIAAGRFFVRRRLETKAELDVAAAGNLLLDLNQVRELGVRFSDKFGLTGGEDTHFSRQIAKKGGQMVWCDESAVTDQVPSTRMTRRWVLARAFSHGNSAPLIEVDLAGSGVEAGAIRVRAFAGGLARCATGVLRCGGGVLIGSRRHQARGLRSVSRGLGMLVGSAGLIYREYAREGDRARFHRFSTACD